jgi:hypothetical protein
VESSGLQWTPLDFDWTLSPLDCDWTLKSGLQSSGSPVDQTGLDWTGHCTSQFGLADWALESTGVQWSPVESSGVHMDYVGEGKDLHVTHGDEAPAFGVKGRRGRGM